MLKNNVYEGSYILANRFFIFCSNGLSTPLSTTFDNVLNRRTVYDFNVSIRFDLTTARRLSLRLKKRFIELTRYNNQLLM